MTHAVQGEGTLQVGVAVHEVIGGGYYSRGAIHGYAWTAVQGNATAIIPTDFSAVSGNGPFCVSGSVGPMADYSGVALVGINLNQAPALNSPAGTFVPPANSGLVYNVVNNANSALRVEIQGPSAATNASDRWCINLPAAASGTIPLGSFTNSCWAPGGATYAGSALSDVVFIVPGTATVAVPFDFCINVVGIQ